MRKRLTQATVKELLDYCPESGQFFWKYRQLHWFKSDRSFHSWNARWPGRPALACTDTHGHLHGKLLGRLHSAHRTAVLWMTGTRPAVVDHENRNRADNRWTNLCPSSTEANARNRSLSRLNRSGQTGVYRSGTAWAAKIQSEYLGSFSDFDEACAERRIEQIERGFSETHGAPRHV
jgi:hypothetical protein